jgi:hypothetical protein
MELSVPGQVPLLIVNHSNRPMNLQLQLRLSVMTGVVVCGPSYISLGELPPSGGSCTVDVRFVALVAGLFAVQGCYIVDLLSGMELQQPALFDVCIDIYRSVLAGAKPILQALLLHATHCSSVVHGN